MHRKKSIVTFGFALAAFLAVGAGVVVLTGLPGATAQAARSTPPAPSATAAAGPSGPAAPAQADGFAMVPSQTAIARPDQPGRIAIPSIGLDARVVEVGIVVENGRPAWETAAFAVGYHRGTALPGTRGNTVMAGHISSPVSKKGDIFRRLPQARIGDRVDVFVGERRISYEVAEIRVVPPTAVQVMSPTPDATLTLITCYPDNVYSKRLVVVSKLVTQPG